MVGLLKERVHTRHKKLLLFTIPFNKVLRYFSLVMVVLKYASLTFTSSSFAHSPLISNSSLCLMFLLWIVYDIRGNRFFLCWSMTKPIIENIFEWTIKPLTFGLYIHTSMYELRIYLKFYFTFYMGILFGLKSTAVQLSNWRIDELMHYGDTCASIFITIWPGRDACKSDYANMIMCYDMWLIWYASNIYCSNYTLY